MENKTLEFYREQLDQIDRALIPLLNERMRISMAIGKYKAENSIPVTDSSREQVIFDKVAALSDKELSSHVVSVYNSIIHESKIIQRK